MKTALHRKPAYGFSLTELMIVVAIVGILAAIVIPNYNESLRKARRSDGQGALVSMAAALERRYTENNTYAGNGTVGGDTGAPVATFFASQVPTDQSILDASKFYYDLTIETADASTFTLRATAKNAQAGNGYMEIDNLGRKFWDEDNSGGLGTGESDWKKD